MSHHSIHFSASLQDAMWLAVSEAESRGHAYAGIEHLLLGLVREPTARDVLQACCVDVIELGNRLKDYLENQYRGLKLDGAAENAASNSDFQRVVNRAIVLVDGTGALEVQGANVLVAMFAERNSYAVKLLHEFDMTRFDAAQYVSHGIAKSGRLKDSDLEGAETLAKPGRS